MRPRQWWVESAPLVGLGLRVSENLGATSIAPVAPVDTSLNSFDMLLVTYQLFISKQKHT